MNKRTLLAVLVCLVCLTMLFVSGCSLEQTVCDDNKSMNYEIPDMELAAGQSRKIPSLIADNGKNATYTLSKEGVVEVKNGTVYALADGNVTVTARIECVESTFDVIVRDRYYKLNVSNDTSKGTIKGLLNEYLAGTTATLNITGKDLYIPDSVTIDGVNYNIVNGKVSFPVTAAHAVTVNYRVPQYTLTIDNDSSGVLTGLTAGSQDAGVKNGKLTVDNILKVPVIWINDEPIELDPSNPYEFNFSVNLLQDTEVKIRLYMMNSRPTTSNNITTVVNYAQKMVNTYFLFTQDAPIPAEDLEGGSTNLNRPAGEAISSGYVYRGLPYNLGRTSMEAFMLDATNAKLTGKLDNTGSSLNIVQIDNSNYINKWHLIYGASCADLVLHAYSTICGDIKLTGAGELNTANGFWKVGDYSATVNGGGHYVDTFVDIAENGDAKMLAAYALLRAGDACARYGAGASSGHAILVTGVHVVKNDDGSINANSSYITYVDTHGAMANTGSYMRVNGTNYPVYTGCTNDGEMKFSKMLTEGYLPITCKQLLTPDHEIKPDVVDSVTAPNAGNILTGSVTATNPISHFTMTITDKATGKVVQQATRLWSSKDNMIGNINTLGSEFLIEWSSSRLDSYKCYPVEETIDLSRLDSGTYNCKLTVYLGCGYSETTRDFDFTK